MSNRLNIAMLGTKGIPARWGGIEKYIEEISARLIQRGHRVTVFSSKWYTHHYPYNYYNGVRIRSIPSLHFQSTDALSNGAISSMIALCSNYDILHFHGFASYLYIPLAPKFHKKTLITVHAMESNWSNEKYGPYGQTIIRKLFDIGVKRSDSISTVSPRISQKIHEMYGLDSTVLYSGIEKTVDHKPNIIRDKYGLQGNDYVLFLGRIDPIKRIEWLIDAAPHLRKGLSLVIAGGSQDAQTGRYLERLKRASDALPSKNILFTGPVAGQEKAELFSNCLLFLAPSKDEGLPIALIEAASYAKPTLASDIPAHGSIIDDGKTGFLFSSHEKGALCRRILELTQDTGELGMLRAVGIEARNRCRTRFNWEQTVDRLCDLYHSLCGRQPGRRAV